MLIQPLLCPQHLCTDLRKWYTQSEECRLYVAALLLVDTI